MMDEEEGILKNKRESNERQRRGQRGEKLRPSTFAAGSRELRQHRVLPKMRVVRARSPRTVLRRYRQRMSGDGERGWWNTRLMVSK